MRSRMLPDLAQDRNPESRAQCMYVHTYRRVPLYLLVALAHSNGCLISDDCDTDFKYLKANSTRVVHTRAASVELNCG